MESGRFPFRLLATLLIAALPPLVAFAAVSTFAGDWLLARGIGSGSQLLAGSAVTVVWAGLVAIVASRLTRGEASSLIEIVERGSPPVASEDEPMNAMQKRLATALDERNRQIANLAEVTRTAPITDDPVAVTRSMAAAARALTSDPTWTVAVLRAPADVLPAGSYSADPMQPAEQIGEVHRWASTLEASGIDTEAAGGARLAVGPWGAFAVVNVAVGEELRAIMLAPWEGRPPPSPADLSLLSLLGQHAATAIEHAVLYMRLRTQADELNRLAAIQGDFLRGVTHDLQTPLTSIGALALELRSSEAGAESDVRADLDTIIHQADRLRRLVAQLLAASRLEVGQLTPRSDVFRVEPILRRTWEALHADRRFEVTESGPSHLAVGDPDRFEQVVWAVLDNAVKYSRPNSRIRVVVQLQEPSPGELTSVVSIADEGSGMDSEAVTHAFEQFYRAPDASRLAPDGSGIGLYAARGLMQAMAGEIAIVSRLGSGTVVKLSLPAEPATESVPEMTDLPA